MRVSGRKRALSGGSFDPFGECIKFTIQLAVEYCRVVTISTPEIVLVPCRPSARNGSGSAAVALAANS